MLELKLTAAHVLEMAISKLKDEICDVVSVQWPYPGQPFEVETNASLHAIGAVLLQSEGVEE